MEFKTTLMDDIAIERAIRRIAHEIIEKNHGLEDVLIIGIKTRGMPLAQRIKQNLLEIAGQDFPCEELDITLYRDDLSELHPEALIEEDKINLDMTGKIVILCDDVLLPASATDWSPPPSSPCCSSAPCNSPAFPSSSTPGPKVSAFPMPG